MTNNPIRLIDIDIYKCAIKVSFALIKQSKSLSFNSLLTTCFLLIGCSTTQPPVPIVDRVKTDSLGSASKSTGAINLNNQFYIVQKGDTLYSIALNHGIDFNKLVEWNDTVDPKTIRPGQRINLSMPAKDTQPALFALPQQPISTTTEPGMQSSVTVSQESDPSKVKTSPRALKLPFSEQNVARLQDSTDPSPVPQILPSSQSAAKDAVERNTRIEIAPQPPVPEKSDKVTNQSDAEWIWPTIGKLLSSFSKNSKGVKISGQAGQPILASAAGEVVYSGHGLRGYGNLIIIKHNPTFLSAYAHNSKILVKEGETVAQGQKIAEMGNTDSDTIQLHFEIRKHGKPVDPLEYLPQQS